MNRNLKRSVIVIGFAAVAAISVARFATADPPATTAAEPAPAASAPATGTATASVVAASIDKAAPDFALAGIDGKTYKLSDFKGKYVVLEWNNLDCPFVKKHYGSGNMQALQKKYTDQGVVWLTICSSAEGKQGYYEAAALQEMTKERKLSSTAYLRDADGTVGKEYGAKTTPNMFIVIRKACSSTRAPSTTSPRRIPMTFPAPPTMSPLAWTLPWPAKPSPPRPRCRMAAV